MTPQIQRQYPNSLAERFWSLARVKQENSSDPVDIVRNVLAILDALDDGETGADLTVNTISFLHLLRQSEAKGDLQYASPEQARGEVVDERSLVFSAGVLIFEKLTGRHPFGAEANPHRMARIRRAEMASGVTYFQTISGPLRTILLRCMGPFPEDRWHTLAELRSELSAFVTGDASGSQRFSLPALPTPAPPTVAEGATPEPIVRRRFARASSRALTVAAEREIHRRNPSIAEPEPTAANRWIGRAASMVVGAAVASAFFLVAMPSGDRSSDAAAAVVPETATAPVAPAPAAAPAMAIAQVAAPAPAPPPTPNVGAIPDRAEPAAATDGDAPFSAEAVGDSALQAARECFAPEKLSGGLEFGASMLIDVKRDEPRVFLGSNTLATTERTCLKHMLTTQPLGTIPAKPTSVSYSFYLDGNSGRVRTRLKK